MSYFCNVLFCIPSLAVPRKSFAVRTIASTQVFHIEHLFPACSFCFAVGFWLRRFISCRHELARYKLAVSHLLIESVALPTRYSFCDFTCNQYGYIRKLLKIYISPCFIFYIEDFINLSCWLVDAILLRYIFRQNIGFSKL